MTRIQPPTSIMLQRVCTEFFCTSGSGEARRLMSGSIPSTRLIANLLEKSDDMCERNKLENSLQTSSSVKKQTLDRNKQGAASTIAAVALRVNFFGLWRSGSCVTASSLKYAEYFVILLRKLDNALTWQQNPIERLQKLAHLVLRF